MMGLYFVLRDGIKRTVFTTQSDSTIYGTIYSIVLKWHVLLQYYLAAVRQLTLF